MRNGVRVPMPTTLQFLGTPADVSLSQRICHNNNAALGIEPTLV